MHYHLSLKIAGIYAADGIEGVELYCLMLIIIGVRLYFKINIILQKYFFLFKFCQDGKLKHILRNKKMKCIFKVHNTPP